MSDRSARGSTTRGPNRLFSRAGLLVRLVAAAATYFVGSLLLMSTLYSLHLVPMLLVEHFAVARLLLAVAAAAFAPRLVEAILRRRAANSPTAASPWPQPRPSSNGGVPGHAASPFDQGGTAPSKYDGVGWVQDGSGWVYKQGDGHFWSAERQLWAFRPDLMSGLPAAPGPVPVTARVQAEAQRLTTPWPGFRTAYKASSRPIRLSIWFGWVGFFLIMGFIAMPGGTDDQSENPFALILGTMAALAFWPACFWNLYYRYMRTVDSHKARAMAWGTYVAVAGTFHALNRRAERQRWQAVPMVVPRPNDLQQSSQWVMNNENRYNR